MTWSYLASTASFLILETRKFSRSCTWFNNLRPSIALTLDLSEVFRLLLPFTPPPYPLSTPVLVPSLRNYSTSLIGPQFCFFHLSCHNCHFVFAFVFVLASCQLLNSTNPKLKPMAVMMTLESIHTGCAFQFCHVLWWYLAQVTLPTCLDFSFFIYKGRCVYIGQCLVYNRHFNKCLWINTYINKKGCWEN